MRLACSTLMVKIVHMADMQSVLESLAIFFLRPPEGYSPEMRTSLKSSSNTPLEYIWRKPLCQHQNKDVWGCGYVIKCGNSEAYKKVAWSCVRLSEVIRSQQPRDRAECIPVLCGKLNELAGLSLEKRETFETCGGTGKD